MSGPWSSPVPVGTVLAGKYRVERVLGVGGMGAVVAATHIDLDEIRAIKLMHEPEGDTSAAVDRFLREARAAVKLKSEHVAKVYDFGRLKSGIPYIVMEYLEGSDLSYLARKEGPLPVSDVAHYMLQACDAIAEAHELGVVHRDLKPANLFLTQRDDGSPCIKVLDFGVSKVANRGSMPDLEITTGKEVLGSPHYMSPEQMRSTKDADQRSDVWSLGAIMYRLLTGKLPFPADTAMELAMRITETVPARPTSIRPEIPEALEQVIMSCLEKDPEARIQSATELALALVPFAPPEALERLPASRRLRSLAPPRNSQGSLADSSHVSWPSIPTPPRVPGAGLDLAQSTWPSLPTPAPSSTTNSGVSTAGTGRDISTPPQHARSRWMVALSAGAVVIVGVAGLALTWRSGGAGEEPSDPSAATAAPPPAETTAAPSETTPSPAETAAAPVETAAPAASASAGPAASASAGPAAGASAETAAGAGTATSSRSTGTPTSRPPTTSTGTTRPTSDPFGRSRK